MVIDRDWHEDIRERRFPSMISAELRPELCRYPHIVSFENDGRPETVEDVVREHVPYILSKWQGGETGRRTSIEGEPQY